MDPIVSWGHADSGGDSSDVQHLLKGVQQVQATSGAFAAILSDRSVVSWGHPKSGGDSSEVKDQLKGVQQIQAAHRAFAAILADGSVVSWGDPDSGGDSSAVAAQFAFVYLAAIWWFPDLGVPNKSSHFNAIFPYKPSS